MEIETFLSTLGLSQHANKLIQNDITHLSDLQGNILVSDLVSLGMSLGHANTILKNADPFIENEAIIIVTADGKRFSIQKEVAKCSGYFKALLETKCREAESGVVHIQNLAEDFKPIHDMITYPPRVLENELGTNLSKTGVRKLVYNLKYFQLRDWIPLLLGNTNPCCRDFPVPTNSEECQSCSELHMCMTTCSGCGNSTCTNCTEEHNRMCSKLVPSAESKLVPNWADSKSYRRIGMTYKGHTKTVRCAALSRDGNFAATCGDDKKVRVWGTDSSLIKFELAEHSQAINSVAFSPDSKLLASASNDRTVRLWVPLTGRYITSLHEHTKEVNCVCFTPDGNYLISAGFDKKVILWDVTTCAKVRSFDGHTSYVYSVDASPDGIHMATGSADKSIRVWKVETGLQVHSFTHHEGYVYCVSYSSNGSKLISGSADKTARVWNLETGEEIITINHPAYVYNCRIIGDGWLYLTAADDKTVRVFNDKFVCTKLIADHNGPVLSIAVSSDGRTLISAGSDKQAKVYVHNEPWGLVLI
eukprot:TRINITY_DN5739_c0_g4_i1.p1 TRINITY_DN5739_c0_g4~~TRINITY_DN5739_c0_g4_i1.p1  ORF type:complete len:532 (+),score=44.78 TRINITY_DN5739_c0_g4_i1:76-1671(+)